MVPLKKILYRGGRVIRRKGIHDDELDLHALGEDALDVHAGALAGADTFSVLRQSRQIRRQFHKNPVPLHTAHDPGHRLPSAEPRGVFLPRAKEFLVRECDPPRFRIDLANHGADILPRAETLRRMRDPGDGDCIHGDQGVDAHPDIHKRAEPLQMRHTRLNHISRHQSGNILPPALFLGQPSAQDGIPLSKGIGADLRHQKGDRLVDTGDQRDVPHLALTDADRPFLARDDPLHAPQIDVQIMPLVAEDGARLQHRVRIHGVRQRRFARKCGGVACRVGQIPLRIILIHHFPPVPDRPAGRIFHFLVMYMRFRREIMTIR